MTTDHGKVVAESGSDILYYSVCSQKVGAFLLGCSSYTSSSESTATSCEGHGCKSPCPKSADGLPYTCAPYIHYANISTVSNGIEPHIHSWRYDLSNSDSHITELEAHNLPNRDVFAMSSFDGITTLGA